MMSQTVQSAADLVVKHFLEEWGNTSLAVLEGEAGASPGTEWCRLTIRQSIAGRGTMGKPGSRRFERNAIAIVQLFVPDNEGTKTLNSRIQKVLDIFEGQTLPGGVWFGQVVTQERGSEGKWLAANVEASFTYEERK